MWLHTQERSRVADAPTLAQHQLESKGLFSPATSRLSYDYNLKGELMISTRKGPPGCFSGQQWCWVFTDRWNHLYAGGPAQSRGLIRPAMQVAQWSSCSLRRRPGSSSPALRAVFQCPSYPCGTPAPLAGGTSSSSPAPADSSAQNDPMVWLFQKVGVLLS